MRARIKEALSASQPGAEHLDAKISDPFVSHLCSIAPITNFEFVPPSVLEDQAKKKVADYLAEGVHSKGDIRWLLGWSIVGSKFSGAIPFRYNKNLGYTRRNFLRDASYLAAAATLSAACGNRPPPDASETSQTTFELYPQPIPDSEYQKLSREQKVIKLLQGALPESWAQVPNDQVVESLIKAKLIPELQNVVIPAICSQLSTDPNCSQDIISHTWFVHSDEEMITVLQTLGESAENAKDIALEAIAIVPDTYFPNRREFSPKYIVLNSAPIVRIWSKTVSELSGKYTNLPELNHPAYLYSNVVQSTVGTLIHESVHYIVENRRLLTDEEEARIKGMYDRINVSGVNIEEFDFLYTTGVSLAYTSSKLSNGEYEELQLNGDFDEALRAFTQNYAIKSIAKASSLSDQEIGDLISDYDSTDQTAIILLQNLHSYLGIDEKEFIDTYHDTNFLGLVDFYESKAKERGYNLNDKNMFTIIRTIEVAMDESFERASAGEKIDIEFYWQRIYDLLEENKISESADYPIIAGAIYQLSYDSSG